MPPVVQIYILASHCAKPHGGVSAQVYEVFCGLKAAIIELFESL